MPLFFFVEFEIRRCWTAALQMPPNAATPNVPPNTECVAKRDYVALPNLKLQTSNFKLLSG